MELDDVIDSMIAERVIHRHRRKWIVMLAVVVVLALVVLALGGWKERTGRTVPQMRAPVTVDAGRFELELTGAKVVHRPKRRYSQPETRVVISLDVRNTDGEEKTSASVGNGLLRLVTADAVLKSNGTTCNGELNYKLVYGMPAAHCTTAFEVPVDFSETELEVGVIGEVYETSEVLGASDKPFWQAGDALAVVRFSATRETETS